MGEKDLAEKSLLGHADVFADSVNALLYRGEEFLRAEELQAAPTETVYPVVGAVLFWGEMPWNYPRGLRELMREKLAEKEMCHVDDVHLEVFEMAHLPQEIREHFKSDMRIVVDYLVEGKEYAPTEKKIVHVEDLLRMLRVLSDDDRYLDVMHKLTEEEKREGSNMCELLDKYWNGGVAEGISQGIVSSVRGMWQHELKAEQIAMLINQKKGYIRNIIHLLELHPEEDDASIARRLLTD